MSESYDKLKQEYEEFTYIVSHDLNGPLRRLREFGNLFLEEHDTDLSEKDRLYIHFMKNSISQLEQMQHALLELSRINTRTGTVINTNCNSLVNKAIEVIVSPDDDISIECDTLPTVQADQDQLYLAFYNLIDNACKFHEDESKKKECRITGEDRIDHFMFQVKDNGIGIPTKFHEEVFKIFRRLHKDDKYKGIGSGLALTRKIINRHGGQIWIDSESGEGTTVVFTLPK